MKESYLVGQRNDKPAPTDTAEASLNARLQRIAQNLTLINGTLQGTLTVAVPVGGSTEANQATEIASLASIDGHVDGLESLLGTTNTEIGGLTETAPASDTASSGLNGRLQRIAQRISSLIGLLPTALGTGGGLKIDGSGTALPVSILPASSLPAGTNNIGKVTIDPSTSLPGGTNAIGKLAPNAGINIGTVSVDQATPGTTNAVALAQIGSTAVATGNGVVGAGVQRVAIASDNSAVPVSASSLPLPSGAATAAKQPALGTAGTPSTDVITVQGSASMTAVKTDGSAVTQPSSIADGSHVTFGAKTDAKNVATDATSVSAMSVWKQISASVQAIATSAASLVTGTVIAAGTALIGRAVADASAATGGIATTARMASAAASTNATNVKTSAGRIYAVNGKNNAAYDVFLVLYDSATNPPVPGTTTIRKKLVCPSGQAFVFDFPLGLSFAAGIGYAFTKLVADADTTALVAADITAFNLDYV